MSTLMAASVPSSSRADPSLPGEVDPDEDAWQSCAHATQQPAGVELVNAELRLFSMQDGQWHSVTVEVYNQNTLRHRVRCAHMSSAQPYTCRTKSGTGE